MRGSGGQTGKKEEAGGMVCTWLYLRSKLKERLKPEADCRGDEWGGVRGEAAFILLQNGLLLMLSVARDLMTRAHAQTHTRHIQFVHSYSCLRRLIFPRDLTDTT